MIVQSLWLGKTCSPLEQTTIISHLREGHEFHLYTYNPIDGIPIGTKIMDASEILPPMQEDCTYSAFSNSFRYKLLFERGGWWIDMDVVCLQPFDFNQERIFACERTPKGTTQVATCAMRVPEGDPIMKYCFDESMKVDKSKIQWGQIGPKLFTRAVQEFHYEQHITPVETFCPVNWFDANVLVARNPRVELEKSYAIHLWNERWNREGLDKYAVYPLNSVYECLKRLSGVSQDKINVHIIELNLTNFCNLQCKNCCSVVTAAPSKGYMPLSVVDKFVTESRQLNWRWDRLKLFGGEPSLHPQLLEVVEKLHTLNAPITMLTNGVGNKVKRALASLPDYVEIKVDTKNYLFETTYDAPRDHERYKNALYSTGCFRLYECGIALNCEGRYFACGPSIHSTRVFQKPWGFDSLADMTEENMRTQLTECCSHCGLFKQPRIVSGKEVISPTWEKALQKFPRHRFL